MFMKWNFRHYKNRKKREWVSENDCWHGRHRGSSPLDMDGLSRGGESQSINVVASSDMTKLTSRVPIKRRGRRWDREMCWVGNFCEHKFLSAEWTLNFFIHFFPLDTLVQTFHTMTIINLVCSRLSSMKWETRRIFNEKKGFLLFNNFFFLLI